MRNLAATTADVRHRPEIVEVTNNAEVPRLQQRINGRRCSVKLANSATTERSDIYGGAGIGYTLAAAKERSF
jgi:hypothetical protein